MIGPAKVAFLHLEQAIYSCDEGKREFGELQKFVEKKNSDMEAAKKELDTLKNQLGVQGAKLTDEARADLEETIENKETLLQRFQQDTQKEIDARRLRATNFISRAAKKWRVCLATFRRRFPIRLKSPSAAT